MAPGSWPSASRTLWAIALLTRPPPDPCRGGRRQVGAGAGAVGSRPQARPPDPRTSPPPRSALVPPGPVRLDRRQHEGKPSVVTVGAVGAEQVDAAGPVRFDEDPTPRRNSVSKRTLSIAAPSCRVQARGIALRRPIGHLRRGRTVQAVAVAARLLWEGVGRRSGGTSGLTGQRWPTRWSGGVSMRIASLPVGPISAGWMLPAFVALSSRLLAAGRCGKSAGRARSRQGLLDPRSTRPSTRDGPPHRTATLALVLLCAPGRVIGRRLHCRAPNKRGRADRMAHSGPDVRPYASGPGDARLGRMGEAALAAHTARRGEKLCTRSAGTS